MPTYDSQFLERADVYRQLTEIKEQHERLLQVIRDAESLSEVTRFVGPSDEQRAASRKSHEMIERIRLRNTGMPQELWPWQDREMYDQLVAEQEEYRGRYGA